MDTTADTSRGAPRADSQNRVRGRSVLGAYGALAKVRLSSLVLLTTAIGFVLASAGHVDWWLLVCTLAGTAASAFGVNAINQCMEVRRDALMERTRNRPLPAGRISLARGWLFGVVLALGGPLWLLLTVSGLVAGLSLLCELVYVLAYTPLKTRTPTNTLVGAVCGALPPMMGWAAAAGGLSAGAWILAAILFVWQIPHFLALAWMYRDDYRRGGFCMLPLFDRDGRATCQAVVLYALTLVPVTLALSAAGVAGWIYAAGATLLGAVLVGLSWRLYRRRNARAARHVFLGSVIYLPLLLGLMLADRPAPAADAPAPVPVVEPAAQFAVAPADVDG